MRYKMNNVARCLSANNMFYSMTMLDHAGVERMAITRCCLPRYYLELILMPLQ